MAGTTLRYQTGAASIEFAAIFVIFFMLFYAVIGYTLPLLLAAAYQEMAGEALREAIRHPELLLVDPQDAEGTTFLTAQGERARQVIDDSWLPDAWTQHCNGYADSYLKVSASVWSVCLRHASPDQLLPSLDLLGWRVPQLPAEIKGEASILIR